MKTFHISVSAPSGHVFRRDATCARRSIFGLAFARLNLFAVLVLLLLAGVQAHAAEGPPALLGPASRSELIRFGQNMQPASAGVLRHMPVSINLQNLDPASGLLSTQIGVDVFDGQKVMLNLDRSENRNTGNYTWYGKIEGYPRGHAILTVVDGHIDGTIELGEIGNGRAAKYQIQTGADGVTVLRQIDQNAFPADHPPGAEKMQAPTATHALAQDASGDSAYSTANPIANAGADSGSAIDVMVIYSNQTAAAAGTAIGAQIQQAVDTANLVYANSGITTRLRLVHSAQLNYNETGNIDTDLQSLPSNSTVGSLRNTYGADVVIMFTEGGGYCGSSYMGPSSSYAYAVVNRACSSSNYSFPHEVGHLFGSRHDAYVDPSTSPYAYGHGYVNCAQAWRDVMAYPTQCGGTRIAYLSTPILMYGSPPSPLGNTSTADNVRVHNQNAVTVGNFRLTTTGTGCTYALSPSSASIGAAGGSASFSVTAGAGCAWNRATNASWLTIGASSGTTASGTLFYSAAANAGPARTATITVGGQVFTVNQATGCTFSLSPSSASFAAAGGSGTTTLSTGSGCAWTTGSSASWLAVNSATSGTGGATISFAASSNTSTTRSANLTIGGATLLATQTSNGTKPPAAAAFSASQLQFGNVQVGRTGKSKGVTLTNSGGATLTIASLTAGGANPGDFKRTGTCAVNTALAPGASCMVYYAFSPTAKGARAATLTIGTNAGNLALSLAGTGK